MVKTGVAGADKLCFALLKQLPAGSITPGDVYIAENLMHILLDNRLEKFTTKLQVHQCSLNVLLKRGTVSPYSGKCTPL